MSKTKSSGLVRLATGREAEVAELYALVKSGKSIYVYGMPSSGVEKIIADVFYALRKGNVLEINVSMYSIGEGKHTENGIATLILDECGESYREPITMSAVVRVLPKIAKGHRIIFRVEHFDEIHKEEDARIFCRLIELVNNELNGKVSFVLSGCHTPQSKIFTGAGVGVQLGKLEHYPIEPFRGCRVQQYLETMYGVNSIDERKLSRIIEATSGDPRLIGYLFEVGWDVDWRASLATDKKFQYKVDAFVRDVINIYGAESICSGAATVEKVWQGEIEDGVMCSGRSQLSAIGVLPEEGYELPRLVFCQRGVPTSSSSSLKVAVDEAKESIQREACGRDARREVKYGKRFVLSACGELRDNNGERYGLKRPCIYRFTPGTNAYKTVVKFLEQYDRHCKAPREVEAWLPGDEKDNSALQRDDARRFRSEQMMAFSYLSDRWNRMNCRMIIPDEDIDYVLDDPHGSHNPRKMSEIMDSAEDIFLNDPQWDGHEIKRLSKRKQG